MISFTLAGSRLTFSFNLLVEVPVLEVLLDLLLRENREFDFWMVRPEFWKDLQKLEHLDPTCFPSLHFYPHFFELLHRLLR